jgi:hypothetical protein
MAKQEPPQLGRLLSCQLQNRVLRRNVWFQQTLLLLLLLLLLPLPLLLLMLLLLLCLLVLLPPSNANLPHAPVAEGHVWALPRPRHGAATPVLVAKEPSLFWPCRQRYVVCFGASSQSSCGCRCQAVVHAAGQRVACAAGCGGAQQVVCKSRVCRHKQRQGRGAVERGWRRGQRGCCKACKPRLHLGVGRRGGRGVAGAVALL